MADAMTAKNEWLRRVLGVSAPQAAAEASVASISPVRLGKCRLIWVQTVAKVHSQAKALKSTVMSACRASGEYAPDELARVEVALQEIDDMVSEVNEELADFIDDVINATPGPAWLAAQRLAVAKADELIRFVSSDPDFTLIDQNEYMATNVKSLTLAGLGGIRRELSQTK
jgi:hypothetical protein